jgi:hypothetical protein
VAKQNRVRGAASKDNQIGSEMEQDDPLGREGGDDPRTKNAGDAPTEVDWAAIEHAHIHGDMSLRRISDAFGSSERTISDRAKKGGWIRLVGTKALPRGRRPRLPGAPRTPRATAKQVRRHALALRLFKVIDAKLQEIETRMQQAEASAAPLSAADTERDVRSVTSLTGVYTKLVELDKQAGSETQGAVGSEDAEHLRRELALRLERLHRAGLN